MAELSGEVRRFVDLLVKPRKAISAPDLRSGSWRTAALRLVTVGVFVLINLLLVVLTQLPESIDHSLILPGVREGLFWFLTLITSFIGAYVVALVLLSKTTGLVGSVRSLVYSGGSFLILHVSAEYAMPHRYQIVLNTIREDVYGAMGVSGIRVSSFYHIVGPTYNHNEVVDLFSPGQPYNLVGGSASEHVYTQPPIVELLTTALPAAIFLLWITSIGYFFYLIYLDIRLNHGGSVLEGIFGLGVVIAIHAIDISMQLNPLYRLLFTGELTRLFLELQETIPLLTVVIL